jgi:CDP-paratose 2-epimerase
MTQNFLITGGAGFIGSNYVHRLLSRGEQVTIYDNLSRAGSALNLDWLRKTHGEKSFNLITADVRDAECLALHARQADIIVHLASQVAVTTSVVNPRDDFEINAWGTFNVVEAARLSERHPIILYASTNKVYGGMEDVPVIEGETRYEYGEFPWGAAETQQLDFHSPYGCSKGTGDQYVRDYYRIYGIPSVVLRQSCIYGPRQFGIEDQGWVAWFIIAAVMGRAIAIYGDGKQVRDLLYVDDLLDAYDLALKNISTVAGQVYNLGGGPQNTISIWKEFGPLLERLIGHAIPVTWYPDWRPGDQRIFIADIRKAQRELGWQPAVDVENGVQRLLDWVQENRSIF